MLLAISCGIGLVLVAWQLAKASEPPKSISPIPHTALARLINSPTESFFNRSPPTQTPLPAGILAPDFTFAGLDGKPHQLQDYHGKRLVLNFWATWCPPCREETPLLEEAYEQFKGSGIIMIGIDENENAALVQQFVNQFNVSYPILIDPDLSIFHAYTVVGLPTTYFVNGQGIIQAWSIGPLTEQTLNGYLKQLLAGK